MMENVDISTLLLINNILVGLLLLTATAVAFFLREHFKRVEGLVEKIHGLDRRVVKLEVVQERGDTHHGLRTRPT